MEEGKRREMNRGKRRDEKDILMDQRRHAQHSMDLLPHLSAVGHTSASPMVHL